MVSKTEIALGAVALVAMGAILFSSRREVKPNAQGLYPLNPSRQYIVRLGVVPPAVTDAEKAAFLKDFNGPPLAGFEDEAGSTFDFPMRPPATDLAGQPITEFLFDPSGMKSIGGRTVRVISVRTM
jgi:hypothetical protein